MSEYQKNPSLLVIQALQKARLALCVCHNCLTTDRPDMPRNEVPGWTIDHTEEIALIDKALSVLDVSNTDSDHV